MEVSHANHTVLEPVSGPLSFRNKICVEEWFTDAEGPVVLMLHGKSVPSRPAFAFGGFRTVTAGGLTVPNPLWHYNWAGQLAEQGIRVFMMDLPGMGRSSRHPRFNEPRNAYKRDQKRLAPFPLATPDTGPYPSPGWSHDQNSDMLDVESVIHFITGITGAPKVHLIGYSAASFVLGPFAMQHPDLVHSLFLLAPIFPPFGYSDPPPFMNDLSQLVPEKLQCPMFIQDKDTDLGDPRATDSFLGSWNAEKLNGADRESFIAEQLWVSILSEDATGQSWGKGVNRIRNPLWWGWSKSKVENDTVVLGNEVPVCIVYGLCDLQVFAKTGDRKLPEPGQPDPAIAAGPPFSPKWLFDEIKGKKKLMIAIPQTGHFMPWETSHGILHNFSSQWIKQQKVWPPPHSVQSPSSFSAPVSTGSYEVSKLFGLVPAN